MEEKKAPLAMAIALDEMEHDVNSEEATFLERALKLLKNGKELKPDDREKLETMHEKYLGEKEDEEREIRRPGNEDDEEIDEADF